LKYVSQYEWFNKEINAQYLLVESLGDSIKTIQTKMRGSIGKSLPFQRNPDYSTSSPSLTSSGEARETIVLEPVDTVFTIRKTPIEDLQANLIFELKGEDGNPATNYLYFNKFALPFLIFICQNFDVILYSRLKTSILNQIVNLIYEMGPDLKFISVLGSNS